MNGDFTELNGSPGYRADRHRRATILHSSSTPRPTLLCGSGCTRQPFQGIKNGVPTNNVIPAADISPITQKMESFLPNYNNPTAANYNTAVDLEQLSEHRIGGSDNHLYDYRVDIDLSSRTASPPSARMGHVVYTNNFGSPYLPPPYEVGDYAIIVPKQYDVEDAYTITPHLTNQFKSAIRASTCPSSTPPTRRGLWQPSQTIGAFGVTNLPAVRRARSSPACPSEPPKSQAPAPATWTTNSNSASTQLTIPNNYALVDNLQWVKGKHVITFGYDLPVSGSEQRQPGHLYRCSLAAVQPVPNCQLLPPASEQHRHLHHRLSAMPASCWARCDSDHASSAAECGHHLQPHQGHRTLCGGQL